MVFILVVSASCGYAAAARARAVRLIECVRATRWRLSSFVVPSATIRETVLQFPPLDSMAEHYASSRTKEFADKVHQVEWQTAVNSRLVHPNRLDRGELRPRQSYECADTCCVRAAGRLLNELRDRCT